MTSTSRSPMTRTSRSSAVALAATLLALGAAGCGGDDGGSNVSASGTTAAGHDMSSMDMGSTTPSKADQEAHASTMQMQRLGSATAGDLKVELDASDPVEFSVPEGERQVTHRPRAGENAHLMLMLSDAETGDRLPDATITLRITDRAGKVVSSGPQYPMIGMGMGIHYGDNVTIPRAGSYVARLVIGPPRIGRHGDVRDRWNVTRRASIPFTWKGSTR